MPEAKGEKGKRSPMPKGPSFIYGGNCIKKKRKECRAVWDSLRGGRDGTKRKVPETKRFLPKSLLL